MLWRMWGARLVTMLVAFSVQVGCAASEDGGPSARERFETDAEQLADRVAVAAMDLDQSALRDLCHEAEAFSDAYYGGSVYDGINPLQIDDPIRQSWSTSTNACELHDAVKERDLRHFGAALVELWADILCMREHSVCDVVAPPPTFPGPLGVPGEWG